MSLTPQQTERYQRHLALPGFGPEGQQRLLQARVLLIGVGGLGSPIALYLTAAGVGTLGLADADTVSLSNLQRQVLYRTADVGRPKVEAAADALLALNPELHLELHPERVDASNIEALVAQYDFIVEGSDNFDTKYLVTDTCTRLGKPYCLGALRSYTGQVFGYQPGSATYRDVFPQAPDASQPEARPAAGVLGCIAGLTGTLQATECIKYLTGCGPFLQNALLTFNVETQQWHRLEIPQP